MARKPTPGARERILDKAASLFTQHGIHAVGLQQVIDECGCGKNLLYREFASKDDLVVAYLDRVAAVADLDYAALDATHAADPMANLVGYVALAVDRASVPEFTGCPFLTATAEFRDADHPVHRAAVEHAAAVRRRIRAVAKRAGAAAPGKVADRLMLLIDGVYATSSVLGRGGPASAAVQLAEDLVRQAVGQPAVS